MNSPGPVGGTPQGPIPRRRLWPAVLVLAGGCVLSVLLFWLVHENDRQRVQSDFTRWAHQRKATLQRTVEDHLDILRFLGALFFSSEHVDRREFRRFARDNRDRLPAIGLLEWLPRIPQAQQAGHEAKLRAEGFPDYHIVIHSPAGGLQAAPPQPLYFPVVYVVPARAESNHLGLDLAAVPEFAAAMKGSVEAARPVMARMHWTNTVNGRVPDWRAFLAVYTNGAAHDTPAQREANLAGFVSAELNLRELTKDPLVEAGEDATATRRMMAVADNVAIQLQDLAAGSEVAFQSENWPSDARPANQWSQRFDLRLGGRPWKLICLPTPAYLTRQHIWQSWATLGGSLLLSVLVAAYLFSASNRELKVNRIVWNRTTELSQANEQLRAEILQRQAAEQTLEEERHLLEALMDSTPDHIYFKNRQSRFLRINRAQMEIFKLTDPAEAVGKSDFDFFTNEHAQAAFDDEQEIMRTGQPLIGREEKETWSDGTVTWVSTTKQCLRDKAGTVIGTFGISRDITAHKLAEEALAEKTQELLRSNQELEQFAYVASHDLQEPLRMIASYTQLLARRYQGRLDQDADEFIGYAVEGASRMQTLINDLLTYSRVDRRGKPFAPTDCDQALQLALDNLRVAIEDAGAVIHRDKLPRVIGDDVQLTQLFQNLISNAIKFHGERAAGDSGDGHLGG